MAEEVTQFVSLQQGRILASERAHFYEASAILDSNSEKACRVTKRRPRKYVFSFLSCGVTSVVNTGSSPGSTPHYFENCRGEDPGNENEGVTYSHQEDRRLFGFYKI